MRKGACTLTVIAGLVCASLFCSTLVRRLPRPANDDGAGVDVVYTWVDSSDEKWAAERSYFLKAANASRTQPLDNANEILISLGSLQANWPWVRRVFIATADGQRFPLSTLSPELSSKISFVDHSAFIPSQFLPLYSAPAIEAHLHKIPGLAERFVLLNDDFFVCPMAFEDTTAVVRAGWWRKEKKFKMLAMRAPLMFKVRACADPHVWAYSLCNVWKSFRQKMQRKPFPWLFWHGPYFLTKQSFERTWAVFEGEMLRVSSHRNRYYPVNVQPINLVMNVAASERLQVPVESRFKGYGRKKQAEFVEEIGRGFGEDGFCQRPVIAFYHQALAKTALNTSLAFCKEALRAYNKSFQPAASGCFCATMPFGSLCTR